MAVAAVSLARYSQKHSLGKSQSTQEWLSSSKQSTKEKWQFRSSILLKRQGLSGPIIKSSRMLVLQGIDKGEQFVDGKVDGKQTTSFDIA